MNEPQILLTPGFSRVWKPIGLTSRFNGLPGLQKPLKQFSIICHHGTGLKPGANKTKR
jgi:hypothetical protein